MSLVHEHIGYRVQRFIEENDHGSCDKFIRSVETLCITMRSQLAVAAGSETVQPSHCPECGAIGTCHHCH